MKDLKKLRESYNTFALEFARTRKNKPWKEVVSYLSDMMINRKSVVLDAGCGYNKYRKYIRGKHICLDFSKELIKISLSEIKDSIYIIADITSLPLRDKVCDYTLCIATIHHLPSDELRKKAINELVRVTKKEIFLSVWYYYQSKFKRVPQDIDLKWGRKYYRYYHLYTISEMVETLKHYYCFIFLDYKQHNIYAIIYVQ